MIIFERQKKIKFTNPTLMLKYIAQLLFSMLFSISLFQLIFLFQRWKSNFISTLWSKFLGKWDSFFFCNNRIKICQIRIKICKKYTVETCCLKRRPSRVWGSIKLWIMIEMFGCVCSGAPIGDRENHHPECMLPFEFISLWCSQVKTYNKFVLKSNFPKKSSQQLI